MGVIDDGIAFAHERFRRADGSTRVEYAWVQDAPCPGTGSPVLYGREYTKCEIDAGLVECTTAGSVDEERLYRQLGLIDFGRPGYRSAAARAAHGTHVMDLACGRDPRTGRRRRADNRPIVCVQLPAGTTADTSGGQLQPHVQYAIDYIVDRADRIALARECAPLPVVINFSYGLLAGPHDGTHPIEAAIDDATRARADLGSPLRVVLPAGNSHLARCHARISFAAPDYTEELPWRVLPDDRTSSLLEIWLPHGPPGDGRIEVRVVAPNGEASDWLGEVDRRARLFQPIAGDTVAMLCYEHVAAPTDRGRFVVAVLPTAEHDPPTALAPSGTWRIGLRNRSLTAGDYVESWIQRDDTPYGYPGRGRQSYFDDPRYVRFDHAGREVEIDNDASPVKRDGSINALATGRRTIVIGGFDRKDWRLAKDSAGGPTSAPTSANRDGPDATAVSDDSPLHPGLIAAGTRSGSAVVLRGTSVAAPSIARLVADRLADGRIGDRAELQQVAAQSEADAPQQPQTPPRRRRGSGRLPRPAAIALPRFWR